MHHYADDHLSSYVRFKLALTENEPAIKAYGEDLWAELPDARLGPIEPSLSLLEALHQRWIEAWRAMAESDWLRTFYHPKRGPVSLKQLAALYMLGTGNIMWHRFALCVCGTVGQRNLDWGAVPPKLGLTA